jgi:glutaredoxin
VSAPLGAAPDRRQREAHLPRVTVYSHADCHLCERALQRLRELQGELLFELEELDIAADEQLQRMYFERVPVMALDGQELCEYFVDEPLLRERLESRR